VQECSAVVKATAGCCDSFVLLPSTLELHHSAGSALFHTDEHHRIGSVGVFEEIVLLFRIYISSWTSCDGQPDLKKPIHAHLWVVLGIFSSKVGHTDLVFGVPLGFTSESLGAAVTIYATLVDPNFDFCNILTLWAYKYVKPEDLLVGAFMSDARTTYI